MANVFVYLLFYSLTSLILLNLTGIAQVKTVKSGNTKKLQQRMAVRITKLSLSFNGGKFPNTFI